MNNGWKQFKIVLKKELTDAFRDGKSIVAAFVIPLVLFPLMFLVIGLGASSMIGKAASPKVAVFEYAGEPALQEAASPEAMEYLQNTVLAGRTEYEFVGSENAQTQLLEGKISIILLMERGMRETVEAGGKAGITLIYDERSTLGESLVQKMAGDIAVYEKAVYDARLAAAGVDPGSLDALDLHNITSQAAFPSITRQGVGNPYISMLVPFLVTFMLALGGLGIAIDLVAGEKERNTFEALLSTSASRFSILSAKFVVVLFFSFLSAIVQSLSMIVAMLVSPEMFFGTASFHLDAGAMVLAFLNLLLLAAFFSSLLLVISAGAKTYREANAKASFISFLPLISIAIMFMDAADIGLGFMFIPIVNVAAVLKMVLVGQIQYLHIVVSLVVNVVLVAAAVWYTLRTFKDERLITRG